MSATPVIEPPRPVSNGKITAEQAHDALTSFEENIGRNLTILRDEAAVRNVYLRKQHGPINNINLTVRSNLEAVFVQLTGNRATSDCQVCKNGTGPFTSCVQHPKVGDGSCANCLYRRQGSSCTHRILMEDSDDMPLSQHRKRPESKLPAPVAKKPIEKRRKTIDTNTATRLESPIPLPAHRQQPLQPPLGPTPAPTPPIVTSQTQVGEPPIHGPGTALGSASDHWLNSVAFSKYASPAPTQNHFGSNDYPTSLRQSLENGTYSLPQASAAMIGNIYTGSPAPTAMRRNDYAPSPTPFGGSVNNNLDHDTSKPMLAYLPRNVSPDVLRSIAQYHQDLADDLRMEAKRLEKEMRQEREREWGAQAASQARYDPPANPPNSPSIIPGIDTPLSPQSGTATPVAQAPQDRERERTPITSNRSSPPSSPGSGGTPNSILDYLPTPQWKSCVV
ncbi:hypothetical protein QBC45DRAFT_440159 [Copromyces sp. CBS 386.78]|nr:hypothetical protein QBC45DRAFT_440159 [Copromyces sp. CBS 386.78]